MSYFRFVSVYRRMLAFGLLTALSSSFGQTFFISLFLPYFMTDFSLSKAGVGYLYAASTLLSALCLPYLGGRIDDADLRRYTTWTIVGMAGAAWLTAFSPHVLLLGAGILGLRLTGQGLLGHISQTVMAREFSSARGRALGVAGLGYPLGEAVLPLTCAAALRFLPWSTVWALVGVGALAVVLPCALYLLRTRPAADSAGAESAPAVAAGVRSRPLPLRDPRFYAALPAVLAPAFVMTGMFLYQAPLSESKGWAPEWMAAAFSGFAVSRALSSLAVGPLIDRFASRRLLAFYLLPLAAGLALLRFGSSPWIAFPYLILAGMTAGANGSIASAIWAELYGASNIGRVRGMAAALAVFGAAASPALMGALFSLGVGLRAMTTGAILLAVAAALTAVPLLRSDALAAPDARRPATEPVAAEPARSS